MHIYLKVYEKEETEKTNGAKGENCWMCYENWMLLSNVALVLQPCFLFRLELIFDKEHT